LVIASKTDNLMRLSIVGRAVFCILSLIGLWRPLLSAQAEGAPDRIYHNGLILTMEASQPSAQAIAVLGEKILAVGSDADILALRGNETEVIDLQGHALLPGFVDAHTHILNDAAAQGMSLDEAQYLALRNGITSLGDLYVDRSFLREIQDFNAAGQLRVRTSLYLVWNTNCGQVVGDWYKAFPPTRVAGEMLRVNGIKIFTDGGSCGRVALSFELTPGAGLGDLWLTPEALTQAVQAAQAGGYQVAIHAIGDRAIVQAQDALAAALNGQPNTFRHRLEHVSVIPPELIARFGVIGAIPVLNGEYPSCHPFGPDLPEGYRDWEWPWDDLRAANPTLPIAWHSDYPFLSTNPFVHLYGFVTRKDVTGTYSCTPHMWLRDDLLTVSEALSIMTRESAYALFRETEVGSLVPGKYADLIVVSQNPLTAPVENLKSLRVLLTMVGGRVVFCETGQAALCPTYTSYTPLPRPDYSLPIIGGWVVLLGLSVGSAYSAMRRGAWPIPTEAWLKGCSLAAMLGGLSWIGLTLFLALSATGLLGSDGSQPEWLSGLTLVFTLVGIAGGMIGLLLVQQGPRALFVRTLLVLPITASMLLILYGVVVTTNILDTLFGLHLGEEWWLLFASGTLTLMSGLALSSLALFFAQPLPRWLGAVLLFGALTLLGFNTLDARAWLGLPFGIAWVVVGYVLWPKAR